MPRRIKTPAVFRNEIADLVQSLGSVGEQRIRKAFRKYQTLEIKKNRGQKPLTTEEIQLLKDSLLWNDYLIVQQLDELEKKLRAREKKEQKTNSLTAAIINPAASVSITNRASTHQSRPLSSTKSINSTNSTVLILSSPNSNSTCSYLDAPSSTIYSHTLSTSTHTQSRTSTETNTVFLIMDSPLIPQCSPSTQRVC